MSHGQAVDWTPNGSKVSAVPTTCVGIGNGDGRARTAIGSFTGTAVSTRWTQARTGRGRGTGRDETRERRGASTATERSRAPRARASGRDTSSGERPGPSRASDDVSGAVHRRGINTVRVSIVRNDDKRGPQLAVTRRAG